MSAGNQADPAKILVVDDEADVRTVISDALKREGHSVVECGDGRSALTMLSGGGIALVVLDLGLGPVSGLDILREVRRTEGHFYGRPQGAPLSPVLQGRIRPGKMIRIICSTQ